METTPRIKIVNKTKDSITLRIEGNGSRTFKMSWEEFNQSFIMESDKIHCHPNEEMEKVGKEIQECITAASTAYIMANAPISDVVTKMANISLFGEKIKRIAELSHCSLAEATSMVGKVINPLYGRAPFPKQKKETPEEYRARKQRQAEERRAEKQRQKEMEEKFKPKTSTMADVPGMEKLKVMFTDNK